MCSRRVLQAASTSLAAKPQRVSEPLEMAGEDPGLPYQQFHARLCSQAGDGRELEDGEEGGLSRGEGPHPGPPRPQLHKGPGGAEPSPGAVLGAVLLPMLFALSLPPDEDLIRQILADGASGISHSQDLGPYVRAETDLISGL